MREGGFETTNQSKSIHGNQIDFVGIKPTFGRMKTGFLFLLLIGFSATFSEGQDLNGFADSIRKAHQIPELAFAVVSKDSILLNVQLGSHRYDRQGSRYFAAYKQHESTERFFTSDYDLSTFRNLSAGGSILYRPSENLSRKLWIQSLKLRYQYNHRSNNLVGHIISLVIGLHKEDR